MNLSEFNPHGAWLFLDVETRSARTKMLLDNARHRNSAACSALGYVHLIENESDKAARWFRLWHLLLAEAVERPKRLHNELVEKSWAEIGNSHLQALAADPALPESEIRSLAMSDEEWGDFTLSGVVGNPSVPNDVVVEIVSRVDGNLKVLLMAAQNPTISDQSARDVFKWPNSHRALAKNPACPLDLLESISRSNEWIDRQSVAQNPAITTEIVSTLSSDEDARVIDALKHNPGLSLIDRRAGAQ